MRVEAVASTAALLGALNAAAPRDALAQSPEPAPESPAQGAAIAEAEMPRAAHRALGPRFVVAGLGLYRWVLSSQDGFDCPFAPSCSRFAEQAVTRAGVIRGGLLASDRLQRCHPFTSGLYSATGAGGKLDDPLEAHWEIRAGARDSGAAGGRSAMLAGALSSALPGAGKLYVGRTSDAISSFLTTGLPAAHASRHFQRDGAASFGGWFHATLAAGFYAGNIWGSVRAANEAARPRTVLPRAPTIGLRGREGGPTSERASGPSDLRAALEDYQSGRYLESLAGCLDVLERSPGPETEWNALGLRALCHAQLGEWQQFRRVFRTRLERIPAGADSAGSAELLATIEGRTPPRSVSPSAARLCSAAIPGAGQALSGSYSRAMLSAGVNLGLGYYCYRTAKAESYLELASFALPLLVRYYRGNIRSAGRSAEARIRALNRREAERAEGLLRPEPGSVAGAAP